MRQIPICQVRDAIKSVELHDLSKQAAEIFTATEPNVAISRDAYGQVIQCGVPEFPEVWAGRIEDMLIAENRSRKGNTFQFGLRQLDGGRTPVELAATEFEDQKHERWTVIHLPEEEIIGIKNGPILNVGQTGYQIQITAITRQPGRDEVNIDVISRSGDVTTIKDMGWFRRSDITQEVLQGLIPGGKNIPRSEFAEVMTALRTKL